MLIEDPNLDQYKPLPGGEGFQYLQPLASVEVFAKAEADKATAAINTRSLLEKIREVLSPLENRILITLKDRSKHGLDRRVKPTKKDPSNRETDWKYPREPNPDVVSYNFDFRYRRVNPALWARWKLTRQGVKRADFDVFFYNASAQIQLPKDKDDHYKKPMVLQLNGNGREITSLELTCDFRDMKGFNYYPRHIGYGNPVIPTNSLMHMQQERYKNDHYHEYGMIGVVFNLKGTPSITFRRDNYFSNVNEKVLNYTYGYSGVNNNFALEGGEYKVKVEKFLAGLQGAVQLWDPTKLRYYTLRQQLGWKE